MDAIKEWFQGIIGSDHFRAYIIALIIIIATIIISRICTVLLRKLLRRDDSPLPSTSIIVNILRICIWLAGISFMLSACFNIDMSAIFAALGIGGIAVSLGLQQTLQNFFGGIQVTLMKIIIPGEHIIVGTTQGIVKDVNWRQTTLVDFDGSVHIIPNSLISSDEIIKIDPAALVSTALTLNYSGNDMNAYLHTLENAAKQAVAPIAKLAKDPWILVTNINEDALDATLRFVLTEPKKVRECRDAALRAIAPLTESPSITVKQSS